MTQEHVVSVFVDFAGRLSRLIIIIIIIYRSFFGIFSVCLPTPCPGINRSPVLVTYPCAASLGNGEGALR